MASELTGRSDVSVNRAHVSSGPSRLPNQIVESRSFALLERLQRSIAASAVRSGHPLPDIPLWSTQAALFSLAFRLTEKKKWSMRDFIDFACRSAEYGSRVFPDGSVWPADAVGVEQLAQILDDVSHGHLMTLVGRTLDYGRTLEWSTAALEPTPTRNLVTAKSQGIFYTPAFVARHLAARCIASYRGVDCPRVCDPAVGGAAFLLAAAELLLERFDPATVEVSLFGTDTDPIAVEVASVLVSALCGSWVPGEPPSLLNKNFLIGDAFGGPVDQDGSSLPGSINWRGAFPLVFDAERPGFDVVLVNPPFGRHKIDSDWLIAKAMRLDHVLLADLRTSGRRRAHDLRSSGFFPLSSVGVLDKSRIGLERAMQLTAQGGSLGALVPSTIAADNHSFLLRQSLVENWDLCEIDEFPEIARLFYDVSQSVSILHAIKGSRTEKVRVRSGVRFESDLSAEFSAEWPVDLLTQISPKLAIPLRVADPRRVLERIHRHPALRDLQGLVNARGEVDVSAFGNALTDDARMTPLVRGDQIDCYRTDLRSDKKGFVDTTQFEARMANSPKFEHFQHERLVGRQCSYLYRHKRLSFAHVMAERAVANSCNYLTFRGERTVLLYLLGLLNSSLLNWRFKVTNSNNHVANSELAELPVPDPASAPDAFVVEICEQAQALSISPNAEAAARLDEVVFKLYGMSATQGRFVLSAEAR